MFLPEIDQSADEAARMDGKNVSSPELKPAATSPSALEYRVVVLRHYKAIFRYSTAIIGADDAEDVTQEAFLRFGRKGGGVRRPREWLLRVARNLCFDRFRAAGKLTLFEDGEPEYVADDPGPAQLAEAADRRERILALVAGLPEPQRSLIVLFDLQGMSGDECARILELSRNQVKVYLHRARRRLRKRMEAIKDE